MCQHRLRLRAGMDAIGLHQRGVAGRNALEEAGQVVNLAFRADRFEDLLKAGVVGRTEIGRHAYPDEQYGDRLLFGESHHLSQVVGSLGEAESAQAIVAAKLDDQVAWLVLAQQRGQALQAAEGRFTANTGVDHACLRETRPYIGAEQLHPALVYRYIVGGAQTVTQNQNPGLRVVRVTGAVNAQTYEQDHD